MASVTTGMGIDPDYRDFLTGASIGKRPPKVKIEAEQIEAIRKKHPP